ncbi:uncharacterized protein ARMOST_13828 [Armillaria ostoyae]|uniref:Uncharacterized protein n=1 Tax=Armillaria ostoyae TaxID=47428 RepID=A0A284RNU5_ARMOS|nr:uncharacterized protein ARMOST_13828 [Armillaria ostoyae]
MTSNPVPESQNRYTALTVEECNNNDSDLHPWDDEPNTGDTAAAMERSSSREIGGGDPVTQRTTLSLKMKQLSPSSLGPVRETLKGLSQSPARAQAKVVEPAGHGAESSFQDDPRIYSTRAVVRPKVGIKRQLMALEGTGETGKSTFTVQAHPNTSSKVGPLTKVKDDHSTSPPNEQGSSPEGNQDKEAIARPAIMKTATGQGAASAQAVNRGHPVLVVEVPDEEDNMAYQIWLAKERTPTVTKKEATSDEPAWSSMTPVLTKGWCKPFEVDWTLCTVCEARNDNTACTALFVWTHQDHVPELLSEIRKGDERAQEQLYELHKLPRYLRHRQSND